MLTFQSMLDLCALITSTGLKASVDPTELNLPGAWVALDQLGPARLSGTTQLDVSVYLIAADADPRRAMTALATMYNQLRQVLTPDGKVRPQGVILPENPTPMPALRVPVYLYES